MNQNKIITKIFVAIFIVIIATPIILFILRVKIEPQNPTDRKISLNFKRNFPLKEDLIKVNNSIKKELLNINSLPEKIIEGKDGWKFLGDSYSDAFSESKGFLLFTEEELKVLTQKLTDRKIFFKAQNIKYYIAVAPNKLTVYNNQLDIENYGAATKLDQFKELCKSLDINFINLGEQFHKEKKHKLYYKTDTHWTFVGGLYGYNEVHKHLTNSFNQHNLKSYSLNDLKKTDNGVFAGDLNDMLLLERDEPLINYSLKETIKVTELNKSLSLPVNYGNDPTFYESRYQTNNNDLKIIVMNDSFIDFFKSYFVQNFGESLFLWDHTYRKDIISQEKPDIFLHEIVERNLDLFLTDLQ